MIDNEIQVSRDMAGATVMVPQNDIKLGWWDAADRRTRSIYYSTGLQLNILEKRQTIAED